MLPLLREIRQVLDAYSQDGRPRYAVGETFLSSAEKAAAYVGADRLHAAFNFELLGAGWSPRDFAGSVQRWERLLGVEDWPNYVLNNHDTPRSATRYSALFALKVFGEPLLRGPILGRGENDARLKVAAALLLTLRGTPFIYYGEEIGMRDIPIRSRRDVLDPIGRRLWPFYKGRDGCRAPMQWDASPNAGFAPAGARPWLPVHPDYPSRNVAAQRDDPRSLYHFYRRLIALRRAHPALVVGMYQPLTDGTRYLMSYLRQTRDQVVLVALNFSGRRQRLVLGGQLRHARWRLLLSTHRETLEPLRDGLLPLAPNEAVILEMASDDLAAPEDLAAPGEPAV
jgi:alpha-glucosidase